MALVQQPGEGRLGGEALLHQAFVEEFQFVGQIADRRHPGHARAALEGVQVALQAGQRIQILRIGQPVLEELGGTVEDVARLFEEDLDHFLVQRVERLGLYRFRLRRGRLVQGQRRLVERIEGQFEGLELQQVVGQRIEVERGFRQRRRRIQQRGQRGDPVRARADLQRRSHLIQHADQCLVGRQGFLEEARIGGQALLRHGGIHLRHRLAELGQRRQLGLPGALPERFHGGAQIAQRAGRRRLIAPAGQQLLAVQQGVDMVAQMPTEQLGGVRLAAGALGLGLAQALLLQVLHRALERLAARQWRVRRAVQLRQALLQQVAGLGEQRGQFAIDRNLVVVEFLDQPLQRHGDLGHRQDAGHVRAALEGMQGALQAIVDRLRQNLRALGEELVEGFQVAFRLVAEDVQQLRVQAVAVGAFVRGHRLGRWRRGLLATGQGMRAGGQAVHIVALALRLGGELLDQLRQQGHHLTDQLVHRRRGFDAAVQQAVEEVFHRPGQFADDQRAYHAAAALEGVEGAPHLGERLAVVAVGAPLRQVLVDGFQDLAGFLDEDVPQFLVHRLLVGGRRQQAGRGVLGGRIDGLHRRGQHIGHRERRGRRRLAARCGLGGQTLGVQLQQFEHGGQRRGRRLIAARLGRREQLVDEARQRCGGRRRLRRRLGLAHVVGQPVQRRRRRVGLRRRRARRIAQAAQAFLGHVENQFALAGVVLAEAFQVVLDAGDGVGQGIQVLPVRHRARFQQALADVALAGFQQFGGALQRNHPQPAAHLGEQLGHAGQMLVIPLRGDELDDGVLGLLQAGARFADHQLVNLRHIGGRQAALFVLAVVVHAGDAGQGRLDVEQRAGNVHQRAVIGGLAAVEQQLHGVQLIEDGLARLGEAEHRQGVGDLLERRLQAGQFAEIAPVAAHEQVEAVLDAHQLLAQRGDHRADRAAIRADQRAALGGGRGALPRQCLVKTEARPEFGDARRFETGLGQVEQQVLGQLLRGGIVESLRTLAHQALEFPIQLLQQAMYRGTARHAAADQALDHAGGDFPQRLQRRLAAQIGEFQVDLFQLGQVLVGFLAAQQAHHGHLLQLTQLAQQLGEFGGVQPRQGFAGERGDRRGKIRREQAGFRQRRLALRGAQLVEQRQQQQRLIGARAVHAIQIHRQLQDRLHQHLQRLVLVGDAVFQQRLDQPFHFLGEQRGTEEFHHPQRAVDLVDIGEAEAQARAVLAILDECFQRLTRLVERLGDFALDPFQGDIVVPIPHSHSSHSRIRVKARTRSSASGRSSGCRQPVTSPTPSTSSPPGARRSARPLRMSRRRQRRK